jgi:HD superfamily phosphohydrolase
MPYAHTLDHNGEGHLWETEWKDNILRRNLLAGKWIENKVDKFSFMEIQLRKFFEEKMGSARKNEIDHIVENLRSDLEWILCDSSRDKLPSSPSKYHLRPLADIVGNTLCADLIDYVQRDLLSAGFRDRISLRPLHFFLIQNFAEETKGSVDPPRLAPRLVLAPWKKTKPDKMRRDVITEAIELLRKRYSLGERVYFHHAKMAAAAMVIKAVALSGQTCEDIWSHGDYSLLRYLVELKEPNGIEHPSASIIRALLKRDLFKTAYELRHKEKPEPGDPVESVKDQYARGKEASERQRRLEDDIAMCVGISSNDIIVYSPDPDMNTKEFRALVWPKEAAKIVRLEDLGEAKPESDELQRKHRSLWRLSVFVRRETLTPEVRRNIRTFCTTFLEQESPEPEILADLFWKSHRAQLSPGPNPDDRDLAVEVVIQALAKSMRSGNNSPLFPTPQEVQDEVKRRKAARGVSPAK